MRRGRGEVSGKAGVLLGLGLGVFIGIPAIGTIAVLLADALTDWHCRRAGLREWARRDWRKG